MMASGGTKLGAAPEGGTCKLHKQNPSQPEALLKGSGERFILWGHDQQTRKEISKRFKGRLRTREEIVQPGNPKKSILVVSVSEQPC